MALSNAVETLKNVVVIQTEVEFLPMYVGQPLFSEIEIFLRKHGFYLHRFTPLVSRMILPITNPKDPFAPMSQIWWSDAIFVRDFTRLELMTDTQLLASARILHEVYRSIDLVYIFLAQLDERAGTHRSTNYLTGIQGPAAS